MTKTLAAALLAACVIGPAAAAGDDMRRTTISFSDLKGWASDDHAEAYSVFKTTCSRIKDKAWDDVCASSVSDARSFFEENFVPVVIEDGREPLFTGYYEPELEASRTKTDIFKYPLYAPPSDLKRGEQWFSRAEIEAGNKLRGLELAYLSDPVEAFFFHVQGSGRLSLPDGSSMRLGFAAKNGHKYQSVGREMARRGLLPDHKLSAGSIKEWVRKNPDAGREVLWHNPSFIFFREIKDLPESSGPIGAMSRPVTAMRSVAVDPDYTPLGAPVWIEKGGKNPINRLMVAQDTGSAIKGAQRADIFYGSGDDAGAQAGVIRDAGRMVVFIPKTLIGASGQ